MKRVLLVIIFVVSVAVLVGTCWNRRTALAAPAPKSLQTPNEGKGCVAPKSWGELKGVSDRVIAFQDSSGTLRILDTGPCMRGETELIVTITRQ